MAIKDLRTYFYTTEGTVKAVDGVNLDITDETTVALVGESGCGKSTIALSIMRLVPYPGKTVSGQCLYKEMNLFELSDSQMRSIRGKDISLVPQDPATYLHPLMKVGDQIAEPINLRRTLKKAEVDKKVYEALKLVQIPTPEKVCERYPHQLSGGMQQRALIAMALLCEPSILIADEPTTALDPTIQYQILHLISSVKEKLHISILLITHDLGIVADISDYVYVMYAGKVVEHADVFELFESPGHPYTIGLLKSVLSIDEFKRDLVTIRGSVPDMLHPPHGCRFHPRCPKVMKICKESEPPKAKLRKNHMVSCWLYGERACPS